MITLVLLYRYSKFSKCKIKKKTDIIIILLLNIERYYKNRKALQASLKQKKKIIQVWLTAGNANMISSYLNNFLFVVNKQRVLTYLYLKLLLSIFEISCPTIG